MSVNQWGAVNQWSTSTATVSASVTEQSTDASESSSASIVAPGVVAASVTEINTSFSDNAQAQITGSFTVDVTDVSQSRSLRHYFTLIKVFCRPVTRITFLGLNLITGN